MSIEPADWDKALLRANITRTREALVDTVEELKHTVRANLEWRMWVGRHPALALGAVLGLGVWLGSRRR
jgi:GTPase SAR1 family protein